MPIVTSSTKRLGPALPSLQLYERMNDMALGDLLKTMKKEHSILGELDRYLMRLQGNDFLDSEHKREKGVWHPSELSTVECIRALVYKWLETPKSDQQKITPQIRRLFDVGHAFGRQMVQYFWDMGILLGRWHCVECKHTWLDLDNPSPRKCPNCGTKFTIWYNLWYYETPVRIDRGNKPAIAGHCDLYLEDMKSFSKRRIGEVKTIKTAERHWTEQMMTDRDYFQKLQQPLAHHLAQLNLYQEGTGVDEGVVLYGNKNDQQMKEFMTKKLDHIVRRQFLKIEQTERALEEGYLPDRISDDKNCGHCRYCPWRTLCHGKEHTFQDVDYRNKKEETVS